MSDSRRDQVRLDSWKAIAEYLRRDVTTVRRWERHGLPVRRIAGARGRSVYAFSDEIDAWLAATGDAARPTAPPRAGLSANWLAASALVVGLIAAGWYAAVARLSADDLRVRVTGEGVVALDIAGRERWRHAFTPSWRTFPLDERALVAASGTPAVYAATAHKVRVPDELGGSGELLQFNLKGNLQRSFSFADEVSFAGKLYGPPWALTGFAVDEHDGRRRIAIAAHHYIWSPSLVTILDDQWQRRGTFAHDGWIESVNWISPDRLLIGGFSEQQNGGMIGVLDPAKLDAPLKMFAMPRSEVNKAAVARFNRAIVQLLPDRILARTVEVATPDLVAEVIYEFTPALEPTAASFSAQYWETHRALEAEGKLDHPRDRCPDRHGPTAVAVWEPAKGWTTRPVNSSRN